MGFLKNVFEFVRSPTHSRTTAVIVLFLILAAIPLTVIMSQQQQQLRQRAAAGQEVCNAIGTLKKCTFGPCNSEGDRCEIDNQIWECHKK